MRAPFGIGICLTAIVVGAMALAAGAGEASLHTQVDALLAEDHPAGQAPLANDADFLRRAYLALHGVIPTAEKARAFFADPAPDKRATLVDALVSDPQFARWIAVRLDVMLMERRAEAHTKALAWRDWLEQSLLENKPWDALVREILTADGADEKNRHVARWLLEREADPNALAKDTGRLFLGRDIACSQCHDHPRIDDYLQRDYAGLQAFFSRTYLFRLDPKKPGLVGEQATGSTTYQSVFTKVAGETQPRLPAEAELPEPPPGEWVVAPDAKDKTVRPIPKNSRRAMLAAALGDGHHPAFRRNIANRLWAIVFGSGLVEPLDLHHSANPATSPALLELLADQIATMKFDMRGFIRELALTQAFQRSLDLAPLPAEVAKQAADKLPALQQAAGELTTAVNAADEEFVKAQKAIAEVRLATAPLSAERTKQEAAIAAIQKTADSAAAEQKKADDLLATKRAARLQLAEAAEAAAANADPAVPAKPSPKLAAAEKEMQAAEKEALAKQALAETQAKALADAGEKAASARAKVDEAAKEIDVKQAALDAAATRKEAARIKARHASQVAGEVKTALAWSNADDAGRTEARETLAVAWGRSFAATELQPLAPEQLCWSAMQATGRLEMTRIATTKDYESKNKLSEADQANPAKLAARAVASEKQFRDNVRSQEEQFVRFFGGAAGQPQTDFFATPEQALYFENGGVVRGWASILASHAAALPDPKAMAEEVYLATLTRLPDDAEVAVLQGMLATRPPEKKTEALCDFTWALITSTEFRFAH